MIKGSYLEITEEEIIKLGKTVEQVQEDLTLPNPAYAAKARFGKGKYAIREPKELCYLRKRGDKYILPRNYFSTEESSLSCFDGRALGRTIEFTHSITLRDYQEDFFEGNVLSFSFYDDVIFNVKTGHGKSVMAIYQAWKVARQCLVLVPTYYLARQWEQMIRNFTNASVHILTPEDKEIPLESDFTIALMETLTIRELPSEFINNVGHLIVDELHNSGASTYLPLFDLFPARYRTGLTATFRRADRVHEILRYHFGELLTMPNKLPRPKVYAVRTDVEVQGVISKNRPTEKLLNFLDENFGSCYHETKSAVSFKPTKKMREAADTQKEAGVINKTTHIEITKGLKLAEEMSYTVLESYLNDHSGRRKITITLIKSLLDAGRTVLFLSKRKATLSALHRYFKEYKPMLIVSETNKRTPEEEEYLQKECRLVLGVMQLAKEGMDLARLDSLVIHLPVKDTEQAIGRICRLHPDKKYPMAFYLLDDCPYTYATFSKAKKFMEENADYQFSTSLVEMQTIIRFAD